LYVDSPAVPPSAGANQLFRGFSYVDPTEALTEVPEVSSCFVVLFCKAIVTIIKVSLSVLRRFKNN